MKTEENRGKHRKTREDREKNIAKQGKTGGNIRNREKHGKTGGNIGKQGKT